MSDTVWVRTHYKGSGEVTYHTSLECRHAERAETIREIPLSQARRRGLNECSGVHCGDTQSRQGPTDPRKYTRLLEAAAEGDD